MPIVFAGKIVTLTSRGQAKAVLLSMEAFQELVGTRQYTRQELMPLDTFAEGFRRALAEAGYGTREKMIDLVRQVKRELGGSSVRSQARMTETRENWNDERQSKCC